MVGSVFIWTEALGCAEILKPMLESYCAHHTLPIHVFVYDEDLTKIYKNDLVIPIGINNENSFILKDELSNAYKRGHAGTALLWASIITHFKGFKFVHLDSDTVFLSDVVSPIILKLNEGYGVIGTRRPYKNKIYRTNFFADTVQKFLPDAVNTHCFGFNPDGISLNKIELARIIQGQALSKVKQKLLPVVDFFDYLTFILRKNKGIFYLDSVDQKRSGQHNRFGKIESSMISFAAVGSGCAFWKNPNAQTSQSYKEFALSSYSLYSHFLLEEQIDYPKLESPFLEEKLNRLDTERWVLRA